MKPDLAMSGWELSGLKESRLELSGWMMYLRVGGVRGEEIRVAVVRIKDEARFVR